MVRCKVMAELKHRDSGSGIVLVGWGAVGEGVREVAAAGLQKRGPGFDGVQ